MGVRLLLLACGLLLGAATNIQREQSTSSAGLPVGAITSYEVVLSDDSHETRTGEMFHTGRLVRVYGRDGTAATASGAVWIVGGGRAHRWGDRLRCVGSPSASGGGWTARCGEGRIEVLGVAGGYFRVRNSLREWVERRLLALRPPDRALFLALFLGVRDDLSGPDVYFFRRAGCIHLLALSGFHLGILSFLIVGALAPFLGKRRSVAAAAVLLIGYLFIAGPKVSLVRAVLMFGLMGGCRLAGIRVRGTDLLGATFLACLVVWPQSLETLSFELSYLALAGIMVLGPPLEAVSAPYLPRFVRAPLAASIGAQVATSPLLAGCFALLYPIGLLSSLLLTPLVTAYLWAGLAYLFIPLPPAASRLAVLLLELIHRVIVLCAELFARAGPVRVGDPRTVLAASAVVIVAYAAVFALRILAVRRVERADDGHAKEKGIS